MELVGNNIIFFILFVNCLSEVEITYHHMNTANIYEACLLYRLYAPAIENEIHHKRSLTESNAIVPAIYKSFYVHTYSGSEKHACLDLYENYGALDINENRSRSPSAGNGMGNYIERRSYARSNEFRTAINLALIRD